jgi:hypothetical protein
MLSDETLWYVLFVAAVCILLMIFRHRLFDGGGPGGGDWPNDSGPDPAPADFRKSRRRRIIDWWQRWP